MSNCQVDEFQKLNFWNWLFTLDFHTWTQIEYFIYWLTTFIQSHTHKHLPTYICTYIFCRSITLWVSVTFSIFVSVDFGSHLHFFFFFIWNSILPFSRNSTTFMYSTTKQKTKKKQFFWNADVVRGQMGGGGGVCKDVETIIRAENTNVNFFLFAAIFCWFVSPLVPIKLFFVSVPQLYYATVSFVFRVLCIVSLLKCFWCLIFISFNLRCLRFSCVRNCKSVCQYTLVYFNVSYFICICFFKHVHSTIHTICINITYSIYISLWLQYLILQFTVNYINVIQINFDKNICIL